GTAIGRRGERFLEPLQMCRSSLEQLTSFVSEHHATRGAPQELYAELLLEPSDRAADAAGRNRQTSRGSHEALLPGDTHEHREIVEPSRRFPDHASFGMVSPDLGQFPFHPRILSLRLGSCFLAKKGS